MALGKHLPCLCGRTRVIAKDVFEDGQWHVELWCKCGLMVGGDSLPQAWKNWDKVIREEREKQC